MRSIYFNGDVLTMDIPIYAQAVLVEDGMIKMVGNRDELLRMIDPSTTRVVNLNGGLLLPGFIDSHSHISAFAQTLGVVQLSDCRSFEDIAAKLLEFRQNRQPGGRDWIVGFGYDHKRLAEQRHPDKSLLDSVLPGYRVLISHLSGDRGVMSSIGLAAIGYTAETKNPTGGIIGRIPPTDALSGYLEKQAFWNASSLLDPPSEEQMMRQLEMAQSIYAQNGITTVQDGKIHAEEWALLRSFSDSGRLKLDINCYIDLKESKHLAQENLSRVKRYKRHLKIGGYSLSLDGAPQDCTAWMTIPYQKPGVINFGHAIYSDEEARLLLFEAVNDRLQTLVHCSGDAAAEQMIASLERIPDVASFDLRPVMLQAQFVRPDQLKRMAKLGIMASFFMAHTYFWGDAHIRNFGEERTGLILPAQAAKQAGVPFTFHQDTPVLMPNMLSSVWCAVNRVTRAGVPIGENQQISTLDALRAVTATAAYQHFEEADKGSITVGKRADFVLLDHNPLRVRSSDIKRIRIMKTIKDDQIIYERKPT